MGNRLSRYWRVYKQFVKNSLASEMEYRLSFLFKNLASTVWMGAALFFINVIFSQVSSIGGWSKQEVIFLYISFSIAADIIHMFLRRNFEGFSSLTRKGELDWLLLRPINSRFMVSLMTRGIDTNSFFRLIAAFTLFGYYFPPEVGIVNALWYFVLIALGILAMYSFAYILHTLNIWLIKLDNITHLSLISLDLSRVPLTSWPKAVQFFFIYLIPVGLFSTFAVETLLNGPKFITVLISILVCAGMFLLSQKFWNFALRHYSSASS